MNCFNTVYPLLPTPIIFMIIISNEHYALKYNFILCNTQLLLQYTLYNIILFKINNKNVYTE